MVQGRLFDVEPPAPLTRRERVERARGYVQARRRAAVCAGCCADQGLVYWHHRARTWTLPVARLAGAGAELERIHAEIEQCAVVCRRCLLRAVHPKMLGIGARASVGLVAKGGRSADSPVFGMISAHLRIAGKPQIRRQGAA